MARGREWLIARIKEAEALGHTIGVQRRDPPPEHPDGRVKFWAVCSCGYSSTVRATEAVAVSTAVWHLGQVTGEASREELERARNGLPPLRQSGDTPSEIPVAVGVRL